MTASQSVRSQQPPAVTVVTGASGWLGVALVRALTGDGPWSRPGTVRAVVRSAREVLPLRRISPRIEVVVADVTRPRTLARAFSDLPVGDADVLHTAGVIHPADVAGFDAVNHQGTVNVLAAAAAAGVRRFVHVSSNSPFGTNPIESEYFRRDEPYAPYLGYGWSKMDAELAVIGARRDGLDTVIVRPPWFYGPNQPLRQTTFFTMVRTGRFPVPGTGNQRRSMVYIDNLVEGVVRAELVADPPHREWWIADPEPYPLDVVVATVGEALAAEGYEVTPAQHVPAIVGRLAESADRLLQARGYYNSQIHVLGELDKTIAVDISSAVEEIGYDPQVTLLEGMRRSIRWCHEQGITL